MKKSPTHILMPLGLPLAVPLLFLAAWTWLAGLVANDIILPPLAQVMEILGKPGEGLISMGSLGLNLAVSLVRVLTGYFLAVVIAVPLGIAMGYYASIFKMLNTFLGLFRPIPPLAWVPLVLAWFGVASLATVFDVEPGPAYVFLNNLKFSMVFIIFIGALYPVLTISIHGVRSVRTTLVDSARVLGANRYDIFRKVLLPAAAPSIVTGMRIGLGVAWMCLVSAEMLPGSLSGVGYLITHAYTVARTDIVVAGMIGIGAVGALLDLVFRLVEDRRFAWQRLER